MMRELTLIFLVALFTSPLYVAVTEACSCGPSVVQGQYCTSEQVMRIKLKNSAAYELWILPGDETGRRATQDEIQNHWFHQERMYKRYKYRVLDLYRGEEPETNYAFTKHHGNMCGGSLTAGKSIVMGRMSVMNKQESFFFGSCNHAENFAKIQKVNLKRFRRREFDGLCNCTIKTCLDECATTVDECVLPGYDNHACYNQNWCERGGNGECGWRKKCSKSKPKK